MAVREFCNIGPGRNGEFNSPYAEKYTQVYQAIADRDDGPLVVAGDCQQSFGAPAPGDYYSAIGEGSSFAVCTSAKVQFVDYFKGDGGEERSIWRYVAQYGQRGGQGQQDPPPGDPLPGDEKADPLERPERTWWEWEPYEVEMDYDADGKEVSNSAFEPFDPKLTREDSRLIEVIQKNYPGETDPDKTALRTMMQTLKNKMNSTTWRGHAADTCLMRPPTPRGPRHENGATFYEVVFRVVVFDSPTDLRSRQVEPEDWGTRQLFRSGGVVRAQKITDGLNPSGLAKLDGLGRLMPNQENAAVKLDGQGGRKGPFYRYKQTDFNAYLPTPT